MWSLSKRDGRFSGEVPYVQVGETFPRTGNWSGNVNLGAMRLSEQSKDATVLMTGEIWFPHVWTLALWNRRRISDLDVPPVGVFNSSTVVRVEFGAGGATQSVEVDFVQGTLLSFPCNSIQVVVLEPPTLCEVYAQVGIGSRSNSNNPQRTIAQNLVVPNATTSPVFKIPSFTASIKLLPGNTASGPATIDSSLITLEFATDELFANIISVNSFQNINRYWSGNTEVPTGASFVRVVNTSGFEARFTLLSLLGL